MDAVGWMRKRRERRLSALEFVVILTHTADNFSSAVDWVFLPGVLAKGACRTWFPDG
jgi:hypothetical protein